MKKILILAAVMFAAMNIHAGTFNYLCGITEVTVDTLKSTTKNQYTLNIKQYAKNIAEYSKDTVYYNTVKLVLNSDDRTLEGTYTTEGADPDHLSANVNDQTINLVSSELYSGTTRRLLRSDSISTLTITKVDDTHYAISDGRLCFTAAKLEDRGKNTYNYFYSYDRDEIDQKGISKTPFVFGYDGTYQTEVYNYDMTVTGVSVFRDDTDFGAKRYFIVLACTGKNRETNTTKTYEVQLAIYPDEASIVGNYATQGGDHLLYSSNCYVKDLKENVEHKLANDSISSILIKSKGEKQYSFYGGTLISTALDLVYHETHPKEPWRVKAVYYYHFSDNGGEGIPFGYDESQTSFDIEASSVNVGTWSDGLELTVKGKGGTISYNIIIDIESENLAGTFNTSNGLSTWSKVEQSSSSSYVTNGTNVYITHKSGNTYTISATLICENGKTYNLKSFNFQYGTTTAIDAIVGEQQFRKVIYNGILYIEKNGILYTIQGAAVK